MSTHKPGFQSFFRFLHHFVLAKLVTSSIRVKATERAMTQSHPTCLSAKTICCLHHSYCMCVVQISTVSWLTLGSPLHDLDLST